MWPDEPRPRRLADVRDKIGLLSDRLRARFAGQWPIVILGLATPLLALTALVVRPGADGGPVSEVVSGEVQFESRSGASTTQPSGGIQTIVITTTTAAPVETVPTTAPVVETTVEPSGGGGPPTTSPKKPTATMKSTAKSTAKPRTATTVRPSAGTGSGSSGPTGGGGSTGGGGAVAPFTESFATVGAGPWAAGATFGGWIARNLGSGQVTTPGSLRLSPAAASGGATRTASASTTQTWANVDVEATIINMDQTRSDEPAGDDESARLVVRGDAPGEGATLVLGLSGWRLEAGGDVVASGGAGTPLGMAVRVRLRVSGTTAEVWIGGAKVGTAGVGSGSGSVTFAGVDAQVNVDDVVITSI